MTDDRYDPDPLNGPAQFAEKLREHEQRLSALEGAPLVGAQFTIIDENGNVRILAGKQADGTYALQMFNAAGQAVVSLGEQADGTYGLQMFDAAAALRAVLGQLTDGSYDLAILDPAGGGELVKLSTIAFGVRADTIATGEGTTSATYADLATVGPTVVVTVGSSGRAIVYASAFVNPDAGFNAGDIGVDIDGAGATLYGELITLDAGVKVAGTMTGVRLVTGLTPGAHTFQMKYRSSNGATTALFQDRTLVVFPY